MAAIANADVSIDTSGNIRWTGAATTNRHTVLEFIQYLMDKQDDAQAAGNDLLDITVDTPFNRSTDQILTLNSPFNIDDTFAAHLYDGSVSQTEPTLGGETLYSGLGVIGPVETGTEYMILQDGKVLPAFWGTGINPEAAPSLVFSRHLIKSKYAGSKIDGQRITVLARELGDQYRRFPVTLGTGNSVAAIGNGADIFNTTADTVIAGWTTIVNTEGFQELNIDGTGAAGQEYYSQWDKGTQSINDTYERTKWIAQRSHVADATTGAATGTDRIVDNGTIVGQGQSFIPLTGGEWLTEARFKVKIGAGTPTGTLYCQLYDSDDAGGGASKPTGAALARSERVLASAITSSYEEVIFRFNRFNPATGAGQINSLVLSNAEYFIVIRNDEGAAGAYFHVDGSAGGVSVDATQNTAAENPAATWTANVADIMLTVKSSPSIHDIPGEIFQGINIEVGYDGLAGAGVAEDDICMWGTLVTYDGGAGGFYPGELVTFKTGATLKSGGTVLYDDGVDELLVALDTPGASVLTDNDTITGLTSGLVRAINVTITDMDKGGGTGIVLAKDDNGATGELYIQVLSGVNPVENNRIRTDDFTGDPLTAYVDVTATINSKTVIPEFLGTSTGSNIIGAYGIGFQTSDVGASDRFISLNGASRVPPNNVAFTVSGLVAGEDRVLVGPRVGTSLNTGQWVIAAGAGMTDGIASTPETIVVVDDGTDTVPFPANQVNWPASGIGADTSRLRVQRDNGIYSRLPYDSHDGVNTFTLGTPDTGVTAMSVAGNNTFTRAAGSFLTDGFEPGCVFTSTGFTNAGNNSTFVALTVTATEIVPTDATGMVTEAAGANEQIASVGWEFANGDGSTDFGNASAANEVFLAFIDVLASSDTAVFTGVHSGVNRNLLVRVRDGGGTPIKTFEATSAQFLSTAQTVAATRTSDS